MNMRGVNKTSLRGQAKSGISSLKRSCETRTFLNGAVTAKRVVIAGSDVESKTDIHFLNPRNQEALTKEAVRDILPSIIENGVNVEGVSIKSPTTGKQLLLDASRRRFCCIEGSRDLPLWELQGLITDEQILAIINDSQEVKRWSYPEHADFLMRVAKCKDLDVENINIEELAKHLSIGRESLRKRLEARNVSIALRKIFPDYEGIPNAYYSKLAKLERNLTKANKNVFDAMHHFALERKNVDFVSDVIQRQTTTMVLLEAFVENYIGSNKTKREWTITLIAKFDDKKVYAKRSKSPDGNTTKFEFSRIEAAKLKKIEAYIAQVLNEKE